jgi:hypothetical protein
MAFFVNTKLASILLFVGEGSPHSLDGRTGMVTKQEIEEVAEKTGLEFEDVRSRLTEAVMRSAVYVKIAGPKSKVRIPLFSVKALPEEYAIARKWLSEHAADLPAVSHYIDDAVDLEPFDAILTQTEITEIAKYAETIHGKRLRKVYEQDVLAQKKRYIKPNTPSSPNWFEIAAREFEAWEHRPRISDNKTKHRLENLRKSSKARKNCPDWFHDDVAVFVVLLLKHSWETRSDKIIAEGIRREFDAVKYWTDGVVSDDSPLLDMTNDNIRVTVGRFRKFGNRNLPPIPPWKERSLKEITLFLWQLLLNTSNPRMNRPVEAVRRATQLAHQLLKIPIPLHPRYLKTHPPDPLEK